MNLIGLVVPTDGIAYVNLQNIIVGLLAQHSRNKFRHSGIIRLDDIDSPTHYLNAPFRL
jgi:hypothetical protein